MVYEWTLNLAGNDFLYAAYIPGIDCELILTVKVETRHPVGRPSAVSFQHFVIIAEL